MKVIQLTFSDGTTSTYDIGKNENPLRVIHKVEIEETKTVVDYKVLTL